MKYYIVVVAAIMAILPSVARAGCFPEWTHWGGNCYRYMSQFRMNWTLAAEDCRRMTPKGQGEAHLVAFHSKAENRYVAKWWKEMLNPLRCSKWQYFWTGFNDIEEEGNFVWEDRSNVTFTHWGGSQPENRYNNSDCVTMTVRRKSDEGRWDDARCYTRRAYMCQHICTDCK